MTEEFDDDVVFENSPLFQYLQDLGHTDFETCPLASGEKDFGGVEEDILSLRDRKQTNKKRKLWKVVETLWQRTPFHQAAATQKLQQQLDTVFGEHSVRCILDQDVLLQEDVELIELLDPSLLTLHSSQSSPASTLPRPGFFAKPSIWDLAIIVSLAAVALSACSEGLWSQAAAPWALALLTWVGLKGIVLWRRGSVQRAVFTRATELQTLVHNSKTLTGLSRKALRLVQETEVISRGFTLVSAATTFSRAAPGAVPRGQQLIGLRKTLYRVLRSAFRASRRATCHMLKTFPLNSEIDNVTNYVSAVPLKELGLGLGLEHLGDEQAQELTDDYSLPALKMLFQLWLGQSSECFRRLALLLSPQRREELVENSPKGQDVFPIIPLYQTISAVTEPLHYTLGSSLSEMQRSYDFHRHFEMQTRESGSERTGRAKDKCRDLNTLHTSIRSLQLHLKTLLSEMIILEDDLEKMMVSSDAVEKPFEGYAELSERLHQLHPHMQASTGCWDDTISQVDRMMKRADHNSGIEIIKQPGPSTFDIADLPQSYPIILDQDPVPEEQEWEAYVSDSDSDTDERGSWYDMLSPEERERQRKEREESRRVLSELKAVLCFRASEGERMKRKQLLFNDQAAETPGGHSESQDSSSKPGSTSNSGESTEPGSNEETILVESDAGNTDEGSAIRSDPLKTPETTEFTCGLEPEEEQMGQGSVCKRGGGGASENHQYDGVAVEGNEDTCLADFVKDKVPTVSLMDRLTEIHGTEALNFSSALATQVASRSRSLITMEEQIFGDDDEEENEEGDSNDDV